MPVMAMAMERNMYLSDAEVTSRSWCERPRNQFRREEYLSNMRRHWKAPGAANRPNRGPMPNSSSAESEWPSRTIRARKCRTSRPNGPFAILLDCCCSGRNTLCVVVDIHLLRELHKASFQIQTGKALVHLVDRSRRHDGAASEHHQMRAQLVHLFHNRRRKKDCLAALRQYGHNPAEHQGASHVQA